MTDLRSLARRYDLPIDGSGQFVPAGNGRLVAFADSELAYTTSVIDKPVKALMRSRLGRVVMRSDRGATVAFSPERLADVLGVMADAEGVA